MGSSDNNYIDPVKFTEILVSWQKTNDKKLMERLVKEFFYPIACGVIQRYRFRNVCPEDAVQECVIACVTKANRFDPTHKSTRSSSSHDPHRKAFSFFTSICMNHYRGMYRAEVSQLKGMIRIYNDQIDAMSHEHPEIRGRSRLMTTDEELEFANSGGN